MCDLRRRRCERWRWRRCEQRGCERGCRAAGARPRLTHHSIKGPPHALYKQTPEMALSLTPSPCSTPTPWPCRTRFSPVGSPALARYVVYLTQGLMSGPILTTILPPQHTSDTWKSRRRAREALRAALKRSRCSWHAPQLLRPLFALRCSAKHQNTLSKHRSHPVLTKPSTLIMPGLLVAAAGTCSSAR